MRTETKQIKIYNFDELSKETQEKLIEKEIQYMYESYLDNFLYYDMEEKAKQLLKEYFKNNNAKINNVYYSLSYSQCDGAMFEFELYYYNKLVKIKHYGHYCHKYSFIIDSYELTEKQEKQLKEKVLKMFEEFETFGWDCVNTTTTEQEAIEILQENEYLADGSIYY
jgi:hypothetical protein